jgi:predicted membrane-bound spermidine synthase
MLGGALIVFFLSGVAALLYQVTWQRLLAIFSGADVYSATMVVAAFMAGLGCGSLAGGHLADRLSRRGGLLAFAAAEAGIALFGFFSKTIFYDVLYGRFTTLADNGMLTAAVLFVVLLWPTALMGASLPLLSRALTDRAAIAARNVGWLYALNTLGAAFGALVAIWGIVPAYGLEGALRTAARLNLVCAVMVVPIVLAASLRRPGPATTVTEPATPPQTSTTGLSFAFWAAVFALSGFIALSFEILWFRVLGVVLKSTAFTFGTMLAHYLFWLGLGSAIGGLFASRVRRPASLFLVAQALAGIYAGISLSFLVAQLGPSPVLQWLHEYVGGYEPLDVVAATGRIRQFVNDAIWHEVVWERLPTTLLRLYLGVPVVLIAPATFLMGLSFPMLQRVVQNDVSRLGRRVGALLLANILGSTVGTLLTGWVLLDVAGTSVTLRMLVLLSGLFALAAWRLLPAASRPPHCLAPVLTASAVLCALVVPTGTRLWATLHGVHFERAIVAEDGSGVSLLKGANAKFDDNITVFVNGLGQSWLPYGGIHTTIGALPALLHPMPRSAAIIGLGSGDTLFGMGGRPDLERIVSIEIVKPQIDTLTTLFERWKYRGLQVVLEDRRIQHVFGDGRLILQTRDESFDIIEADALRPNSAFAGNLYSDEYFKLLRDRLNPGGYAVTWVPTDRVGQTFLRVFEHAAHFGSILIGSNAPIQIDHDAVERRLTDPVVQQYFGSASVRINELIREAMAGVRIIGPDPERLKVTDINTDVHPKDEFVMHLMFDRSLLRPEGSR